ncbi:uncharacterized protein LY89DRAFT_663826 [Mollisia scopiformis]|uniref:Uncharacterized protein n=1 Tax=Mollisia scopiformis TaxID=149040 RepID=A0A194XTK7_MOLSC|nr:uncharacterized protein LY89DRAFT_663826 [Mollisia scopiformis]KUJ23379.1 hypothetical protein LY89DRAFT_663826 [Mollisia scopiformis]
MAGLSSSLASAVFNASAPELKDILRQIASISPFNKETVSYLLEYLQSDKWDDCSALRDVVFGLCEQLPSLASLVEEALIDNEEEVLIEKDLLEDSEEPGYESARSSSMDIQEASRKRKWKWKMHTVPRSESKRTRSADKIITIHDINRSIATPKSRR